MFRHGKAAFFDAMPQRNALGFEAMHIKKHIWAKLQFRMNAARGWLPVDFLLCLILTIMKLLNYRQ